MKISADVKMQVKTLERERVHKVPSNLIGTVTKIEARIHYVRMEAGPFDPMRYINNIMYLPRNIASSTSQLLPERQNRDTSR